MAAPSFQCTIINFQREDSRVQHALPLVSILESQTFFDHTYKFLGLLRDKYIHVIRVEIQNLII